MNAFGITWFFVGGGVVVVDLSLILYTLVCQLGDHIKFYCY